MYMKQENLTVVINNDVSDIKTREEIVSWFLQDWKDQDIKAQEVVVTNERVLLKYYPQWGSREFILNIRITSHNVDYVDLFII